MTCAELDRWLDDGMPEADSEAARAHASSCERCAAGLEAALAIEAAFAMGSPLAEAGVPAPAASVRAPEGFASSIMARIGELEAARNPRRVDAPSQPWWIRLLSDPVAAVSTTVAVLTIVALVWNPEWFLGFGGRLGARWLAWAAHASEIPGSSTLWLGIFATAVPFALWWMWQISRKLERAMVLQLTRPGA